MTCPNCQRSAARVRELQDELDAWRASEVASIETEAAAVRLMRWQKRLGGLRPVPVRALVLLADMKGRVLSLERIAGLGGRRADDLMDANALAFNTICHARTSLRPLGLARALETVRDLGYRLTPEAGRQLRTLMGDFEGSAFERSGP